MNTTDVDARDAESTVNAHGTVRLRLSDRCGRCKASLGWTMPCQCNRMGRPEASRSCGKETLNDMFTMKRIDETPEKRVC